MDTNYILFGVIVVVGMIAFSRWFWVELIKNPSMAFSIALMYSLLSKQVSLLFIEIVPSYLPEQETVSSLSGASIRILIMHLAFLAGLIVMTRFLNRLLPLKKVARNLFMHIPSVRLLDSIVIGICVLLVLQFINIKLSHGVASLEGEFSRYDFWDESARFPILATIFGKTMAFVPPLLAFVVWGCDIHRKTYRKWFALILLGPYLLFLYSTGHRFTMTVLNLGLFLSVAMFLRVLEGKRPVSKEFAVGSLAVLIGAIVVGSYDLSQRYFAKDSNNPLEAFVERAFVIQGATLWTVDEAVMEGRVRGSAYDLIDGMSSIRGIVLSAENAESYEERSVNLSAGLPAICQIAFGTIIGTSIIPLFGIYMGFIFHLFSMLVARGTVLGICVGSLLLSWSNSLYGVASLRLLFDWKYFLFLLLSLALILIPRISFTLGSRPVRARADSLISSRLKQP